MENKDIYQNWLRLSQLTESNSTIACFEHVEKQYTQKNRHYHTLNHIQDLFNQIQSTEVSDTERMILAHAALFHDVIYVSRAKDNEYQSAAYATLWLAKLGIDETDQQSIHQLIIATATHTSDDPLTRLFLDMDLSILGASQDVYQQYCKAIQKEYKNIPLFLYKRGRKRFLEYTLTKLSIFNTKKHQELYEKQARVNIKQELNLL